MCVCVYVLGQHFHLEERRQDGAVWTLCHGTLTLWRAKKRAEILTIQEGQTKEMRHTYTQTYTRARAHRLSQRDIAEKLLQWKNLKQNKTEPKSHLEKMGG